MQLPIVFNNRYQLNKKLGEGGLAEVYLAQDLALSRLVAVKLLRTQYTTDPTFLVRFHREAQNAASLNSSNVVAVHDFGQDHKRPYIVMEYVAGDDLRTVMDRGLLTVPQIVEYAIQICTAVGMAHRRGMVHGDLKPGNILISPENQAKVTDFGLARALGESAMDDGELVWGTPAYFAPEQAAGDRMLPATDVYAIGIILYEMLSGSVPFLGETDQEIARKQLYENPKPLSQRTNRVPSGLEALVHRSLLKSPAQRFHTADQLQQALLQFKYQNSGYRPLQATSQQRQPAVSIDWVAIVLAIVAIIAVLGLVPLWTQVYQTYIAQGPPAPAPTSMPELAPGQVRMPSLEGLNEAEAKEILAGVGLGMEVNRYQPHQSLKAFSIIQQSVPAGMPINQGAIVYVSLSQGQNFAELPSVINLNRQSARHIIQEAGFLVQETEVWSQGLEGIVLDQEPPANTLLAFQSLVLLRVGGGTKVAANINFDNSILLLAYELPGLSYTGNETIPITLFWQVLAPPKEDYHVMLEITNLSGQTMAQYQGTAATRKRAGVDWLAPQGELIDPYQLIVPSSLKSDTYQLRLSLTNPQSGNRLVIIDSNGYKDVAGTLILQEIRVN